MVMSKVFVEDTEIQDIANAIREKNGTETKYLPSEMGGAIREMLLRTPNTVYYRNDMKLVSGLFEDVVFEPETEFTIVILNEGTPSLQTIQFDSAFNSSTNLKKLTLIGNEIGRTTRIGYMFSDCNMLEELDVSNYNFKPGEFCDFAFNVCPKLQAINGIIDFTDFTGGAMFNQTNNLKEVRLKNETLKAKLSLTSSALSDESIQSIIDGLAYATDETSLKLTLHSEVVLRITDEQLEQINSKNWYVS